MKKTTKSFFNISFLTLFFITIVISCNKNDDDVTPTIPLPSCSDGIKNQDEVEIDCGGVCTACSWFWFLLVKEMKK